MKLYQNTILLEPNVFVIPVVRPRAGGSLATPKQLPARSPLFPLLCAAALLLSALNVAATPAFTTICSLTDEEGIGPDATLAQGTDGYFYGTARAGGTYGKGTVFKVSAAGALGRLYSFTGGNDGSTPSGLVQGSDGLFYGTTYGNNYATSGPYGSVFKISAAGKLTTLFTFTYRLQGLNPAASLIQGSDGYFYGTTYYGGTNFDGTIFKIDTNGVLTSMYSFTNGLDGEYPEAALVQGRDGAFYGTAYAGGKHGQGTVFKITPAGVLTSLHSFNGDGDGSNPSAGLALGSDGYFYGTTYTSPLVQTPNGNFNGTVFKMNAFGTLTTLHFFYELDGSGPAAALVQASDGYFYGTTTGGGGYLDANGYTTDIGWGTVFKISATGSFASLYASSAAANAPWFFQGGVVQGADGNLYGASDAGGTSDSGCIYQLKTMVAPWITVQPASTSATNGGLAQFQVVAAGNPPLGYQWQQDGTNLANGGGILGASNTTLLLTVTAADAGPYTVIVTNAYGSVTSIPATLTVIGTGAVTLQAGPLSGGSWSLIFPTAVGQSYTVQQNADLSTTNWTFYTNVTGNGSPAQLAIPLSSAPSQFFRVLEP